MPNPVPVVLRGVDRGAFTVSFATRLRAAGMPVGLTSIEAFTAALGAAPVHTSTQLYWVSRTTLVRRRAELEIFDAVFAEVFREASIVDHNARRIGLPDRTGSDDGWAGTPATSGVEQGGNGLPWITLPTVTGADDEPDLAGQFVPERLPSALEAVADSPFGELDDRQLAAVGQWIEAALAQWPLRRGRRRRVHPAGKRTALRATLHRARRTGFEPVELVRSRVTTRRRRVVMLCDVSRSMQATTTAYLHLMRAAALRTPTEVFAFSTRFTRLTAVLSHRSAHRAIDLATATVDDRFGGTRIAATIDALLRSRHGPTVRGATVVIASDGWDTDPPEALDRAMQRLRLRAHAVIWVNPRVVASGYEPVVGGMAAALPYCDELLSGHSLRSLIEVVSAITRAG